MATFQMVSGYLASGNHKACQHCGKTGIKQVVVLSDDEGNTIEVGSVCAIELCIDDNREAVMMWKKRADRAAREWKNERRDPVDGETKEQYVARRIIQMGNARNAHMRLVRISNKYGCSWNRMMRIAERANRMGISVTTAQVNDYLLSTRPARIGKTTKYDLGNWRKA